MKKIFLYLILLFFFASLVAQGNNRDYIPPQEGEEVNWVGLLTSVDVSKSTLTNNEIEILQLEMMTDYQEKKSENLPQNLNYCYDPIILYYCPNEEELSFELNTFKGLTPGFIIRQPLYVNISFYGKILDRQAWYYSVEYSNFPITPTDVLYTVCEIELGNGKGCLPIILIFNRRR